ncbi:hypothetical protein H5410_003315 [Solanum commersonii]|uniref:Uncharacterized protein n=1 Tax=Solanum commersonii TaxID=4109 RepID=A0A9J6B4C0_SOLCO|nr:hypothetical protein H5410_003315 [Solanum commersonii]
MTNSTSFSKTPISQQVENPSSFNFSIPPPDETPSTPVYGVNETDESITSLAKVMDSPILPSEDILLYSPTLILSSDKSQNSEAQSIAKHVDEPSTEEVDVVSRGVSSTMSERLTSLRGVVQLTFSEPDNKSEEQVPLSLEPIFDQTPKSFDVGNEEEEEEHPTRWHKIGIRGANTLTVGIIDLEMTINTREVDHIVESIKSKKERQRKGKGKMVVSHSKEDKRRYGTRSETQKVLGSAIAVRRIQTEMARKRRRAGHEPKKRTSTPLPIGSSDTESENVEEQRVKSKEMQKVARKSPVKRGKVKKVTTVKSS